MNRPFRRPSKAELILKREIEKLSTALVCLRTEMAGKDRFVGRLEFLLSQRARRIDDLTGTIQQLRDQNKRLDSEAERLAEMVRLT